MPLTYTLARIYTSEEARFEGKPLHQEIVRFINRQRISARCQVTRGVGGCYENGEIATSGLEVLSFNLPLEITVIFPKAEGARLLPQLEAMVDEGLMTVEDQDVHWHKCRKRMIPRQIRVRDIMTPDPVTLPREAPAAEAFRIFLNSEFHGIPVLDEHRRPIGMLTHGDLFRHPELPVKVGMLREFAPEHLGAVAQALATTRVEAFMTRPIVVVSEDEWLAKAVDLMIAKDVKRLPVVASDGTLAGMLSRLDVFKTIMDETPGWMGRDRPGIQLHGVARARDAMRADTPTLPATAPVWEALQLIESTSVRRVAIVDTEGKLLGLISDKVLMAAFANQRPGLLDLFLHKLSFAALEARHAGLQQVLRAQTAGAIMRTDLITVLEDDPLDLALRRMVEKKLKRIPVVDGQGHFQGMLTRGSLLRAGTAEPD
jgi:CBS domain-containing protein/PII-like signaling protein